MSISDVIFLFNNTPETVDLQIRVGESGQIRTRVGGRLAFDTKRYF